MIRYRHDRDPLVAIEQQKGPNELRSVVMQQVVIPMAFHQFWDQHGDVAIRPLDLLLDSIVNDRLDDEAIGRIKYNQSRLRKTSHPGWFFYQTTPLATQLICLFPGLNMQHMDLTRQGPSVAEGIF